MYIVYSFYYLLTLTVSRYVLSKEGILHICDASLIEKVQRFLKMRKLFPLNANFWENDELVNKLVDIQ